MLYNSHDVGVFLFFFSSRRRHTRLQGDWSSDVCSSDLVAPSIEAARATQLRAALAGIATAAASPAFDANAPTRVSILAEQVLRIDPADKEIGRASCRERV